MTIPMIRTTTLLLMAALGLTMSATPLHAANIQIMSLPYTISAPGTYVLTKDLIYTGTGTAISVLGNLTAPVVLNLKGHTLTGSGKPGISTENFSVAVFVSGNGPGVSSITIENGTITNFGFGVWAEPSNAGGSGESANNFSSIDVNSLVISFALTPAGDGACILFDGVNSSSVSNCTFSSADYGIEDDVSAGGNRYDNDSFTNLNPLSIFGSANTAVLEHCQFAPPATN
jgi:hypothetical protein